MRAFNLVLGSAIYVTLGAFATMISGIVCAIAIDFDQSDETYGVVREYKRDVPVSRLTSTGAARYVCSLTGLRDIPDSLSVQIPDYAAADVPTWTGIEQLVLSEPGIASGMTVRDARGWPLLAFWGCPMQYGGELQPFGMMVFPSTAVSADRPSSIAIRGIPFLPLWTGLIIDVFFFAFVFWLLVRAIHFASSAFKRRLGKCRKCGYDLRGLTTPGCPECGYGRTVL